MYRVLLRLRKGEEVKYLSHRDYVSSFEYALRRARIPAAYSEGFNPRPRMSFGSAIGVGVTSDDERIQLELTEPKPTSELIDELNAKLPKGMEVLDAEVVQEGVKSPLSKMNASEFRLEIECGGCDLPIIRNVIGKLLSSEEIKVLRQKEGKTREIDIRPYVVSAHAEQIDGQITVKVALKSGDSGGAGPRDFVAALRGELPEIQVIRSHRTRQFEAGA